MRAILEAVDGWDGINRFRELLSDVVVTDMYMPGGDGLTVIQKLRAEYPTLKILQCRGPQGPTSSARPSTRRRRRAVETVRGRGTARRGCPLFTTPHREDVAVHGSVTVYR